MQDHGNDHSNKSPLETVIFTVFYCWKEYKSSNLFGLKGVRTRI